MSDMPEVPGTPDRPWQEGDEFRLFFDNDAQLVGRCSAQLADELNRHPPEGKPPLLQVSVIPEVFFSTPEMRDVFDILMEAGGELHVEQLEHRWEQRQQKREAEK